ncbi:MAG: hypothetical protein RIQ93_2503 [Verrucomicrobiota bacterium]|jgi:outer membrane scaffolding protein for murein synthesis (MipA/OmpV family)
MVTQPPAGVPAESGAWGTIHKIIKFALHPRKPLARNLDVKTTFPASAVLLFLTVLCGLQAAAPAQPASGNWSVAVGGGALMGPAFPGSSDYQIMIVPSIRVRYGDKFAASVERGITYNFVNTAEFVAGPLLRVDFGREADGKSLFRIAGKRSTALTGFADVSTTLQAGAFVGHRLGRWNSRLELMQGVNGHEAFTSVLSVDYSITAFQPGGPPPPFVLTTGPRLHWGAAKYHNAYFGVDAQAARGSGLRQYEAGSGLTSAGWSGMLVRPLNRRWSLLFLAGYERLLSPASDSPLVREKGSQHQFRSGAFLSYTL